MMSARPCVIVLAAGHGTRFLGSASHKLSQPLGGSTVLANSLSRVMESGLPAVVITTSALAPLAREIVAHQDVVTLANEGDEPWGMGRSIAAGVLARPNARGWLVMPADMPLVRPDTLLAIAAALAEHPIAFAQHRGRRGHPVGFAGELYSELAGLKGDEGARRVMARYPAAAVEVNDAGVLMDIDTAEDLLLAQAYHAADTAH